MASASPPNTVPTVPPVPPVPSTTPTHTTPALPMLHCDYFAAGACRSCSLIETPYAAQLAAKSERCMALLPQIPQAAWLPPVASADRGYRNRAKLVVGGVAGVAGGITLGILGPDGRGVDLRECAIQAPEIAAVIPTLAAFIERSGLAPYDVPARRGELKFVHVTVSPDAELMLRFVTRTAEGLTVIRSRIDELRRAIPHAAVISVNLLPEHKAVLEGDDETVLHGDTLTMRCVAPEAGEVAREVILHLQPQSFFQTNTAVALELYAQARRWVTAIDPASLWDLYCGVGGFALHCARPGRDVLGVEIAPAAVASAARSARQAGVTARFLAADATAFALAAAPAELPELVIVNPPRRGIGVELATWLERAAVPHVVYSSCNPESLAKDLAQMPGYAVREARVFDMFPHTTHLEVAVLLERVATN